MQILADLKRVERWEQRSEWPLAGLATLFLIAYAWPILDPHLNRPAHELCRWSDWGIWVFFAADYLIRISLADNRASYCWRHLHDLAIIVLPVLRPLRLLRLVMLLRLLNRSAADSLRGRVVSYVAGASVLLVFCAALAEVDAERSATGSNIHTFGDALWWALTTVTTVGYGDHYPVTMEGRLVAGGLMIGGIALLGAVTAAFASWLIDRVRDVEETEQAATRRDIEQLTEKLNALLVAMAQPGVSIPAQPDGEGGGQG